MKDMISNSSAGTYRKHFGYGILIVLYVLLFAWQVNHCPGENYPGWDHHWASVRSLGQLHTIERAVRNFEIPAIDPYTNFGFNTTGEVISPWWLCNALVLILPVRVVLGLSKLAAMAAGGIGAYLLLSKVTKNDFVSFLGALACISTQRVMGNISMYQWGWTPHLVPLLCYFIHCILERKSVGGFIGFAVICAMMNPLGLWIFTAVTFTYSFVVGWFYFSRGFLKSLGNALLMLALALLAGAIFLIPWYVNCEATRTELLALSDAIGINFPDGNVVLRFGDGVKGFFTMWGRWNPWRTLYGPYESAGFAGYVPAAYYLAIAVALIGMKFFFKDKRRQIAVIAAILLFGLVMLLQLVFQWSPAGKIMASVRKADFYTPIGFRISMISIAYPMAAYICLGAIASSKKKWLKVAAYALIIAASLAIDFAMIVHGKYQPSGPGLAESSNIIQLPMKEPLHIFPWMNIIPILLIMAHDFRGRLRSRAVHIAFPMLAIAFALFSATVYNELHAHGQGLLFETNTRDAYRWNNYRNRKAAIDRVVDRYDPNYRTLFCSNGHWKHSGRDIQTVAETELHTEGPAKTLFSYREYLHPYTGLVSGTFKGGTVYRFALYPPRSEWVVPNLSYARLMGVRQIISIRAKMESPELIFKGTYDTPIKASDPYTEGGPLYVYEMANPTGVAFLAQSYRVVSRSDALKLLYNRTEQPWDKGIVLLEEEPTAEKLSMTKKAEDGTAGSQAAARITSESYTRTQVQVSTPEEKYLVLSYIHRPNWRACIDGFRTKIYRAYGGFMCVRIPAGRHSVTFRYYPVDVYIGLALTVLAFLAPFGIRKIF